MKTITCKQLGGACNKEFQANTFEKIAEKSKKHGLEMHQIGDKEHAKAMKTMKELMDNPAKMKAWFESKQKQFESLPSPLSPEDK